MLLAGALAIAITVLLLLTQVRRTFGPTEAIARWAAARGLPLRGDGVTGPLHVIGAREGRMFTLSLSRMEGVELLMVAVDCESAADGPQGAVAGAAAVAGSDALCVRIQNPPADLWDRLDEIVDGLQAMARELEVKQPGAEVE